MSASVKWDGLSEFQRQLQKLPTDLAEEASNVVIQAAESTAQALSNNYPQGKTGNLCRYVKVVTHKDRANTAAIVVSAAPHAHLFENGTSIRQTRKGANRGRMPQAPESERLIPRAIRARERMTQALIQIVKDAGFEVSGS